MSSAQPFNPTGYAFTPVQGPKATAPNYGLVASAQTPDDPNERWEFGLAWRPETCIEIQYGSQCEDFSTYPSAASDDVVYYRPNLFRVSYICPTRQVRDVDLQRATRQCEAATSFAIAKELWTGAETATDTYTTPTNSQTTNFHFASSAASDITPVPGTPLQPAEALGRLEQAARNGLAGQQAYIHMTPTMAEMDPYNFRAVGNLVYTEQGNIIVPDAGYPGTGPTGADPGAGKTWMYATGAVTVRMSPVDVITTVPVQTLNRSTNQRELWAQRYFAATFDPCVLFAVLVDTSALG